MFKMFSCLISTDEIMMCELQSLRQQIPHLSWNPKVHYHLHKSPPLVPILSQKHPVHIFPHYFPKIYSNIILPSILRSSEWSLPFRFSNKNIVCTSHRSHACYIPCPSHPPWFNHPNNIWWSIKVWNSSALCSLTFSICVLPLVCERPCFTPIQNYG